MVRTGQRSAPSPPPSPRPRAIRPARCSPSRGSSATTTLVLRRVVQARWPQPRLRQRPAGRRRPAEAAGATLVEVQGQHDQVRPGRPGDAMPAAGCLRRAGAAAPGHRRAHGAAGARRRAPWPPRGRRSPRRSATRNSSATRCEELSDLAPVEGEEEELAKERQRLQQGERRNEASPRPWPNCRRATAAAAARATRCAAPPARWSGCRRRTRRPQPQPGAALARRRTQLAEAETLLQRLMQRGRRRPAPAGDAGGPAVRPARRGAQARRAGGGAASPARQLKERLGALDAGTASVAALEKAAAAGARAPISPPAGR